MPPPGPAGTPPPPPDGSRRWLGIVAVAVVLVGATAAAVMASRLDGRDGGPGGGGSQAVSTTRAPVPTQTPPRGGGSELTLLAGRVVVAAGSGWQPLDGTDQTASVRLPLRDPTGRELLSILGIATLSSPRSLDTTLLLDGGTAFEVRGTDGPLRVTAQPGPAARIVAGAVRPRGTFFLNVSIFARDGREVDVATLRALFTDQIAPALRFP